MSFRIGANILLDFDGKALQSYNFSKLRILGCIKQVLVFMDKYEVDEIHLIIPLKGEFTDTSEVFINLKEISIATPLSIGGGINSGNLSKVLEDPYFERFIFNNAFFGDTKFIKKVISSMGRQSVVAYMPFIIDKGNFKVYNSRIDKFIDVNDKYWKDLNELSNELILLDADAEGTKGGFNFNVLKLINFPLERVLISGGITNSDVQKAKKMNLAGVSIDNSVLHSEFSIKELR